MRVGLEESGGGERIRAAQTLRAPRIRLRAGNILHFDQPFGKKFFKEAKKIARAPLGFDVVFTFDSCSGYRRQPGALASISKYALPPGPGHSTPHFLCSG